jgi:hypothetical protein
MRYALVINGVAAPVFGAFTDVHGTEQPANVLAAGTSWTPATLAAIGVYEIQDAWVPPGKRSTGSSLVFTTAAVVRQHQLEDEPALDMVALRQERFAAAMAHGNAITDQVTKRYSDAEARTWPLQREQAARVLAGGTLAPTDLLVKLAANRGITPAAYAATVEARGLAFEAIVVAAVDLRRGAEALLSPELDTPEKLEAVVEALKAKATSYATALGLEI